MCDWPPTPSDTQCHSPLWAIPLCVLTAVPGTAAAWLGLVRAPPLCSEIRSVPQAAHCVPPRDDQGPLGHHPTPREVPDAKSSRAPPGTSETHLKGSSNLLPVGSPPRPHPTSSQAGPSSLGSWGPNTPSRIITAMPKSPQHFPCWQQHTAQTLARRGPRTASATP